MRNVKSLELICVFSCSRRHSESIQKVGSGYPLQNVGPGGFLGVQSWLSLCWFGFCWCKDSEEKKITHDFFFGEGEPPVENSYLYSDLWCKVVFFLLPGFRDW